MSMKFKSVIKTSNKLVSITELKILHEEISLNCNGPIYRLDGKYRG